MVQQINNFSLSRLNNQEVSALHNNVLKLLKASEVANLGLTQQHVTDYEQKAVQLTDQVYTTTASEFTQVMHDADNVRTIVAKRILTKLSVVKDVEQGSDLQKIASKVKSDLLTKYGTPMLQLPAQEKTAVVKGFVYDLREHLTDDDRQLLAITADITRLEQANDDFQQAYHARSTERATAELQRTANLRNELTDLFLRLCVVIEFNANMATEAAKREGATAFIKLLNVILNDALTRLRSRKGLGGGASGGSGNGGGSDAGGSGSGSDSAGDGGNGSGSGTSGGGTGSGGTSGGNTGGNDHEIHDGVTEW